MRAKLVLGLAALLIALVFLASRLNLLSSFAQPSEAEPTYKGVPASEWIQLLDDRDSATREDAHEAVVRAALGPDAAGDPFSKVIRERLQNESEAVFRPMIRAFARADAQPQRRWRGPLVDVHQRAFIKPALQDMRQRLAALSDLDVAQFLGNANTLRSYSAYASDEQLREGLDLLEQAEERAVRSDVTPWRTPLEDALAGRSHSLSGGQLQFGP